MQEPAVIVNKRLRRSDGVLMGLSLGSRAAGTIRYCHRLCDQYRTFSLQCYDSYAVTWLTDRDGKRLRPVYTSYDDIHAYRAAGRVVMTVKHPMAHLICTAVSDQDCVIGDRKALLDTILNGH